MRTLLLCALLLVAIPAAADLPLGKWATARPISPPEEFPGGPVHLVLDEPALSVQSLSEYRVVQGGRTEVPYRMVLEDGTGERTGVPCRVVSWDQQTDAEGRPDQVAITLDLGREARGANLLDMDLAGDDFSARVAVIGTSPSTTVNDTIYRRGAGFQKTWIQLPPATTGTISLTLTRDQGRLPTVNGIHAYRSLAIPRRLEPVPATMASREDPRTRQTVLEFDPGKLVRDIVELRFQVEDPVFHRPVFIEIATAEPEQGEDIAYSVSAAGGTLSRAGPGDDVVLAQPIASPVRFLRASIANRDDRPLTISQVTLWRARRGLMFLAEPGRRYELWYGRNNVPEPVYDLAKLPLTPPQDLPEATLGEARALPLAPPPPPPWSETHPALFWLALIVVAVLLLLVVVKAMRRAGTAGA